MFLGHPRDTGASTSPISTKVPWSATWNIFLCKSNQSFVLQIRMYRLPSLVRPLANGARAMTPRLGCAFSTSHKYSSPKEIKFGGDAKALMLQGVDLMADAVGVTLGPKVCCQFFLTQPWCLFQMFWWQESFKFVKAVSEIVLEMINVAYRDNPLLFCQCYIPTFSIGYKLFMDQYLTLVITWNATFCFRKYFTGKYFVSG